MNPEPAIRNDRLFLLINGEDDIKLASDLLYLEIHDNPSQPVHCELHLNNLREADGETVFKYFNLNAFDFGDLLEVRCGQPGDSATIFQGQINRIESRFASDSTPVIVVHAEDNLQKLRYRTRTRVYGEMRDDEILQQILGEYGLSAEMPQLGPVHGAVTQLNQDDLSFVRQRLLLHGAYMRAEGNEIQVERYDLGQPAHSSVAADTFDRVDFSADLRGQSTVVGVAGWNVQGKQTIAQTASFNDLTPGPGTSGGQELAQAFFDSHAANVTSVPDDAAQAESLANALNDSGALQFVRGTGELAGCIATRPGDLLHVTGAGELFSGDYIVHRRAIRHDSENGSRTALSMLSSRIKQANQH